jgi:hypothetical protein
LTLTTDKLATLANINYTAAAVDEGVHAEQGIKIATLVGRAYFVPESSCERDCSRVGKWRQRIIGIIGWARQRSYSVMVKGFDVIWMVENA